MKPLIKTPSDYPEPLNIVGEQITVLASNEETSGYELFIQQGPEGSGPPPHCHDWDESFFVLDGAIEFGYDDQSSIATRGTLVHLPAGSIHWFRFAEGGGKMLSISGSNSNAAVFFTELAKAIPSGEPEVDKLLNVAGKNGVDFKLG